MLPSFMNLLRKPDQLLALGLGSGLSPKAPGTFGTLAAIPFYLLIAQGSLLAQTLVIILTFVVGISLCQRTADALGVHDHPAIVWDEFVGYWATMLAVPLCGFEPGLLWIVFGFILFRLFDITKPWPIAWVDGKVSGGLGIMLDDLLAAVYAGGIMAIVMMLL